MSSDVGENLGPEHPRVTRRHGYRYFFYRKHHNPAPNDEAQWLPDLSRDEEFAVFDLADFYDLSNEKGDLFGLRIGPGGEIMELGTRSEQIAEFPMTPEGQAWHGYPCYPRQRRGDMGRQRASRPMAALRKMEEAGLLTAIQRRRLAGGKHA